MDQGEDNMPLLPGKKNIGTNIKTEQNAGKPHDQSVAIALNVARKSGAKIPKRKSDPHLERRSHNDDRGYNGRG